MIFKRHSNLEGTHSFLSASNYHWVTDDLERLEQRYRTHLARQRGTLLHAFAEQCIRLGQKLPDLPITLNMYVNDAIGYGMTPEVVLFYSDFAYGTADTISFRNGVLRIHDLKTGDNPASMTQLHVYAAYFCLEYNYKPYEIEIVTRIYQNDEIIEDHPGPDKIVPIMDKLKTFTKRLTEINREELGFR